MLIFSGKELLLEKCKKSGAFSNAIFEPYRAPVLLRLEAFRTHVAQLQSFENSWKFHMFLFTHFGEPIWIKWPKNIIIGSLCTSKIRLDNFLPCPIPTYPENFMKILPRVLETTSKKKKKNKEKET